MSGFVVCAFFTDNYADQVASLAASVESFGLAFYKKRYDSRGFWEANTRIKPEFLLHCLDKFPDKDVLYLDADSVMKKFPDLLVNFNGDIGVYASDTRQGFTHSYLTGTLFLTNNDCVRRFLHRWIESQGAKATDVDQDGFQKAVQWSTDVRVVSLPASYTKIFDRSDMGGEAVIEHYQASRRQVKLARLLNRARNVVLGLGLLLLAAWVAFRSVGS